MNLDSLPSPNSEMDQALLWGLQSRLNCLINVFSRPLSRFIGIARAHRDHRDISYIVLIFSPLNNQRI